jgi:LysM repeat protein
MYYLRLVALQLLILFTGNMALAKNSTKAMIYAYIDQYKSIAISEMERVGIPASIKLAQGLLESDFGRSDLANVGNNHFGIKCGSKWEGPTFYKIDDEYAKGKPIESCFRAFSNAKQSYVEHSNFLRNPRKSKRYDFLFDYNSDDYVAWALGLKKAGYATDPKYPDKLISIIEKYELYKFDKRDFNIPAEERMIVQQNAKKPSAVKIPEKYKIRSTKKYKKGQINGIQYVTCQEGDTPEMIAKMQRLSVYDILEYNEGLTTKTDRLEKGQRIFLDKKKKSYKDKKFHKVRRGQTMYNIAQMYGVSLKVLYSRNRIVEGDEPKAGEKIQLRGMRLAKAAEVDYQGYEPEFLFEEGSH